MADAMILGAFALGAILGGGGVWLLMKARERSEAAWSDRFKSIAAETLRESHESFLQLAESRLKQSEVAATATLDKKTTAIDEMIKPVKETLGKMDAELKELRVTGTGAYKEIMQAVTLSNETQQKLRHETGQLLQALRTPNSRGQWGEIQVRRILEMTGMAEHTRDFSSQHHLALEDGNLRPDYVVHLPGGHAVIIDSKVPLTSYLDGSQSSDDAFKRAAMEKHAKQLREHIRALSSKAYWNQVEGSPDFVVLFVPADHFLSGALDCDPELLEFASVHHVIPASPITLIALLRTVAMAWGQESLREHAKNIGNLGGELCAAIAVMAGHVSDMGSRLSGSIDCYNKMIGSLERNVLTKARKMRDLGAEKKGKDLPEAMEPLDKLPRGLQMLESSEKEDAA